MIICRKCGKVELYKIKQIITNEIIYTCDGFRYASRVISTKDGEPRCPECGGVIKFFIDAESEEKK